MISLLKAKKVYFGGKLVTTRFKKLSEDDKRQIINPNFMEMGIATLSDGCIIIDSDGPKSLTKPQSHQSFYRKAKTYFVFLLTS